MMHKRLVAMLLSIFIVAIPLHASNTTRALPTYSSLETSFVRLEELAQAVKDPKLSAHIQNILTQTENVINLGPQADPSLVKQTALSVQKVMGHLLQNALKKEHQSTSSPECSLCSELSEIEEDLRACCQEVQNLLIEVLQFLEMQFPCDSVFAIDHVPFPITVPGKYCVTTDLLYTGSAAAITVMVDDVTINFHNHSLTLQNPNATGVLVQNVDEFVLENDVIQGAALFSSGTGSAVHLVNVNKATIENIFTKNTTTGILIEGSTDVFVKNSLMQFHAAGVSINSSQGVTVDSSTFEGADFGFAFFVQGTSENITLTESTFTRWSNSIFLNQVTGMLIDECLAIASGVSAQTVVQLGNSDASAHQANDVIIRNSSFIQHVAMAFSTGMSFVNGFGSILENLVVDAASIDGMAIFITGYNDVFANGCVVIGPNLAGLEVDFPSKNITFADSYFAGARENIVFSGCSDCTIKNSTISHATLAVGILIRNDVFTGNIANDNAIVDCTVFANTGAGITINTGVTNSHISGNRVFGNSSDGILNNGTNSEFYFNTSCNNLVNLNCAGVISPAQQPSDIAVVGSNICCSP